AGGSPTEGTALEAFRHPLALRGGYLPSGARTQRRGLLTGLLAVAPEALKSGFSVRGALREKENLQSENERLLSETADQQERIDFYEVVLGVDEIEEGGPPRTPGGTPHAMGMAMHTANSALMLEVLELRRECKFLEERLQRWETPEGVPLLVADAIQNPSSGKSGSRMGGPAGRGGGARGGARAGGSPAKGSASSGSGRKSGSMLSVGELKKLMHGGGGSRGPPGAQGKPTPAWGHEVSTGSDGSSMMLSTTGKLRDNAVFEMLKASGAQAPEDTRASTSSSRPNTSGGGGGDTANQLAELMKSRNALTRNHLNPSA
ncbi:hypothetical protein CYMTET_41541, partial [Cymbomonas tetramitiformis]